MIKSNAVNFIGLSFLQLENEHLELSCCLVRQQGEQLSLISHQIITGNLQQVIKEVPKGYPVCLSISGKSVLHRIVRDRNQGEAFHAAFPTLQATEFYVQIVEGSNMQLVSLCRKEVIDVWLERLERAGLKVYAVGFGGVALLQLHSFLKIGETWNVDGFNLSFAQHGKLYDYTEDWQRRKDDVYLFGEEKIGSKALLPYAMILQLLYSKKLKPLVAEIDSITERRSIFWAEAYLKKWMLWCLGFIFVLLLINFLCFSYLNDENKILLSKVGRVDAGEEELEVIRKDVMDMELLLGALHWNDGYNYGFLTNDIGQSLPRALELNELVFNSDSATDAPLVFIPTVKVTGQTSNLMALNNWLFVIKHKNWVKSARLLKCKENKDSAAFDFEILITY